jgi:hypothetical protein
MRHVFGHCIEKEMVFHENVVPPWQTHGAIMAKTWCHHGGIYKSLKSLHYYFGFRGCSGFVIGAVVVVSLCPGFHQQNSRRARQKRWCANEK